MTRTKVALPFGSTQSNKISNDAHLECVSESSYRKHYWVQKTYSECRWDCPICLDPGLDKNKYLSTRFIQQIFALLCFVMTTFYS